MKATIVIILGVMLVSCGSSEKYNSNLRTTADTMLLYSIKAEAACNGYENVWSEAIQSGYKDFNDELATRKASYERQGFFTQMKDAKNFVDSMMKTLNEPPQESAEKYKKVMELYGYYSQYHTLAISPSGSLMSFRNQTNELSSSLVKLMNELKVMNLLSTDSTTAK